MANIFLSMDSMEVIQSIIVFYILNNMQKKKKIYDFILFIISLFMIVSALIIPVYSDTFILFVLLTYLSTIINKEKHIGFSLLIVTIASVIPTIDNHLTFFFEKLFSLNLNLFNDWVFTGYMLFQISLSILFATLLKKILVEPLIKIKKEDLAGYLIASAYLIFLIYDLRIYISEMPPETKEKIIIDMMFIFIVLLFFIGITVTLSISKNKQLMFDKKQKEFEYAAMEKYTEEINKQYQEIRKFRHDYINILSSMEHYIREKEFEQLAEYYYQNILPTKRIFEKNNLHLNDIQKIKSSEIKSILITKLVLAQEKNISVQVEIRDDFSLPNTIDPVIFIRILGILLDNAIEELESLNDGELKIAVFYQEEDLVFIIQNTCRSEIQPIYQLKQEGYSTKGENRGLGLKNVDDLIRESGNILLETIIRENQFTQIIRMTEGAV